MFNPSKFCISLPYYENWETCRVSQLALYLLSFYRIFLKSQRTRMAPMAAVTMEPTQPPPASM